MWRDICTDPVFPRHFYLSVRKESQRTTLRTRFPFYEGKTKILALHRNMIGRMAIRASHFSLSLPLPFPQT